jgi:hypothetical protein
MINLTRQDLHEKSPRCQDNCPRYKVEGCEGGCNLRLRAVYRCPHCKAVGCYYGMNNPIYCQSCKRVLPDYWKLEMEDDPSTRITYHLRGNTA